jgi:mRNA-degrading endonuclease RelE of RelBE toxin-antitoxin system
MIWDVKIPERVKKQIQELPDAIHDILYALLIEIRKSGPDRRNWPNYGKLKGKGKKDFRHCHIKKGNPTYVAVWQVLDKRIKLVEVRYVGTHEGADYKRIL